MSQRSYHAHRFQIMLNPLKGANRIVTPKLLSPGATIFAPVGRMALTNYVSQSIICTFIFYGTGLGLGGQIGPAIYFPIGIVVYCTQMVFSRYWLKYFQFGPLEWLWRILTYGQWLSLIRKSIARERTLRTGI